MILIVGGFWFAGLVVVEALSYVHGLAPADPNLPRFGLGIPVLILIGTIFLLGPKLSRRGLERGKVVVLGAAFAITFVLLLITPATFAVLFEFFLVALAVAYHLRPRMVVIVSVVLAAAALAPLIAPIPGDASASAPAWLVVFVPVLWAVSAVVTLRRRVVNQALAAAREQALTDPLTGLGNLRRLREAAEDDRRPPQERRGGLLLIDLDNFKAANTLHGHGGGDRALCTVADALRRVTAEGHTIARVGGDEIAVLAPDASPADLPALATTYRDAVRAANAQLQLPGIRLDASVGVARWPQDGSTLPELLAAADRAMYAVKATRPDRRRARTARAARPTPAETGAPAPAAGPADGGYGPAPTPADAAGAASAETADGRPTAGASVVAGLLAMACAAMLASMALPGADPANRTATVALCVAGLATALAVALVAPHPRTLSHPGVDVLSAGALIVLLYLTGGTHSPGLVLVLLIVLMQSMAIPPRSLPRRLAVPAIVVFSPLAYQDILTGAQGPTTVALLSACLVVIAALTLTMHGSEAVLQRLSERSRKLADTDPLTGLANRRAFSRQLELALASEPAEPARELAVVMLDLDDFADVNTRCGHQAGDVVLRHIADALRGAAREQDCVARVGGDEFAVILPDAGAHGAQALSERFVAAVLASASRSAAGAGVGASAGYALYPQDGATPDELMARADEALMLVKAADKGAVRASAAGAATPA